MIHTICRLVNTLLPAIVFYSSVVTHIDLIPCLACSCFMPELSAALLSTMLPVLVAILGTVALLSHSCVYWSRWEDYHTFYYDTFNKTGKDRPASLASGTPSVWLPASLSKTTESSSSPLATQRSRCSWCSSFSCSCPGCWGECTCISERPTPSASL